MSVPRKLRKSTEVVLTCSVPLTMPVHWIDRVGKSSPCSGSPDCPVCEFQRARRYVYAFTLDQPGGHPQFTEIPIVLWTLAEESAEHSHGGATAEKHDLVFVASKLSDSRYKITEARYGHCDREKFFPGLAVLNEFYDLWRLPVADGGGETSDVIKSMRGAIDSLNRVRLSA